MKFLSIFMAALVVFGLTAVMPAQAQEVTEENGNVTYSVGGQDFLLCANNQLREEEYAQLLQGYMNFAVQERETIDRYLQSYDVQNQQTNGALDQVIQQQQASMTPEQMQVLYGPYQNEITQEEFFKLHILNATAIMNALVSGIGMEAQQLCASPQ